MSKPKKMEFSQREIGVERSEKPEFGTKRHVLCASVWGATSLGLMVLFGGACRRSHDAPGHQDVAAAVSSDAPIAQIVSPYSSLEDMPYLMKYFSGGKEDLNLITEGAVCELEQIKGTSLVLDLIQRLSDPDPGVKQTAMVALSYTKDPRAVQPLIGMLSSPEVEIRREALNALGALGDPRAVDAVIGMLSDPENMVQYDAARALGEFGATTMVAGNIPGKTQTLALGIYSDVMNSHDSEAYVLMGISVAIAFAAMYLSERYVKKAAPR